MRIGVLAPPFVRVPPRRYGGTERVVAALTDALPAANEKTQMEAKDLRNDAIAEKNGRDRF